MESPDRPRLVDEPVCLVIPPSGFLLDERVFPSLGILKVAAALESAGIRVHALDLSGEQNIDAVVTTHLQTCTALHIGITATTPQMPQAMAILRLVRRHRPDARVILGGPHVTLTGASAKSEARRGVAGRAGRAMEQLRCAFDVLVCGDGERAVFRALEPDAPAIVDADEPKSSLFLTKEDLEIAPFPARHLIDLRSYRYDIEAHPTNSLIGQLGCPFGCGFCGGRNSPFLRRIRTRPPEHIIAEMVHLYETYGTTGFMFLDDELNVNTAFMSFLQLTTDTQRRLGTTWRMRGLLKAELLTDAMAGKMIEAGFRQVLIGFESADPRILTNINKRATREQNTRCVDICHRHGLKVKALMSMGHPGETLETVRSTRDWLVTVRPDDFDVTIITVYPGTPYFDEARESAANVWTYAAAKTGDLLHARTLDHLTDVPYYKGVPGAYQAFVWTDALSSAALVEARDSLEADVRERLGIPYPTSAAAIDLEHSMGCR